MKTRLSILYFLQFAVWGCYLTSFGQFLGAAGLGRFIAWFYAAIGLVSILTPALLGHVADRFGRPAGLLGICHAVAAVVMAVAWVYVSSESRPQMTVFYPLYLLFLAFYMPTMALANTTSFALLKSRGMKPVDAFPAIRVWGTVGFVAAMWLVNSAYFHNGVAGFTLSDTHPMAQYRFQYNAQQLLCASVIGIITALYSRSLPAVTVSDLRPEGCRAGAVFNVRIISGLLRSSAVRVFLVFVALTGVCLQISNGFVTSYITHFSGVSEYTGLFASGNATMLFSISQISEAVCILLVGAGMKRSGIRGVFAMGILAWSLRFLFLGLGNPGDGLWMLVASMIVYGLGFDFVTIAGQLYMEQRSPESHKGLGQGVVMLMSNGVGATAGTLVAGEVINHWCQWRMVAVSPLVSMRLFMGEWMWPWLIFAGYAALLFVAWIALGRRAA